MVSATIDDVTRPATIRRLLREIGVRPYQGWGQHFLIDPTVPDRMVALAGVTAGQLVVEIGPGLGVLTGPLLAAGASVVAVEIDPRLVGFLGQRFAGQAGLRLVEGDILRLALDDLVAPDAPFQVVANLPYAITGAVLRHLLAGPRRPRQIVVMLQREVAQRLVAAPPEMSLLAVSVQFFGQPRLVLTVPAASFYPPPEVDSAVIALAVTPPPLPEAAQAAFFRLVAAGFGQRRKTLANSLSAGLGLARPTVVAALTAAAIAPERRAETLTVADWLRLVQALRGLNHRGTEDTENEGDEHGEAPG